MAHEAPSSEAVDASAAPDLVEIERALDTAAHLLPAQGPLSVFVHHNPLHALEGRSFEAAVVEAGALFDCEAWLPEHRYREELERGRIDERDLMAVASAELGATADERIGPFATPSELLLTLLRHPVDRPAVAELDWLLAETDVLERFRTDAPVEARHRVVEGVRRSLERAAPEAREEQAALRRLFGACLAAVERAHRPLAERVEPIRHRDFLLRVTGADADSLSHPLLIRFCAAYLDQGLAHWPMPERDLGLLRCFRRLYAQRLGARWMADLAGMCAAEERAGVSSLESIRGSLVALGVDRGEIAPFVKPTLLALRGWAGMVAQIEKRPDRAPVWAPPATLADFLAVRLLLERAALTELAREHADYRGPLRALRRTLGARLARSTREPPRVPAYVVFQLAQLLGRSAADLEKIDALGATAVLTEIEKWGSQERCRLLHLAYERRYRVEVLDALIAHGTTPPPPAPRPRFQVVFCIDEREESLRRHLEEAAPDCETFGVAGFFGVAMYYRGAADARAVPLCPVAIRPEVEVEEQVLEGARSTAERRARARRALGRMVLGMSLGSKTFARGAVLAALTGALAAFPLVFRVLFPRSTAWLRRWALHWLGPPDRTRLALASRPGHRPALGARSGFTTEEMARIVRSLLEESGLGRSLSPLVMVLGHGSSSLNNPHESAHDCGACGGGRGGPNARAFATMANDPGVRARLAAEGVRIPEATLFLGAYHDTCNDSLVLFDLDAVPDARREEVELAKAQLDLARAQNAHERCRRFEGALASASPGFALAHVEARAEDLAQTRPEYGHATNAMCVVGRRTRTRGLFLDRRAFLASYDASLDDAEGSLLASVLAAVVPVTAGINLEYYFSNVDRRGYGADTKLPHNLTSLLGVMDGHASDLRTGLPWQMVEIHEPVRLLLVVEASRDQLTAAITHSEAVRRVVQSGWIQVAALDPGSNAIETLEWQTGEFSRYAPEGLEIPVASSSMAWYAGRAEHLRCARIDPTSTPERSSLAPVSSIAASS